MQGLIVALCLMALVLLIAVLGLLLWLLVRDLQSTETGLSTEKTELVSQQRMQTTTCSTSTERAPLRLQLTDIEGGRRYQVDLERSVIFGRTVSGGIFNDVGISPETSVSKRQFQVFQMNRQVYLCNLSQTNATRVNGRLWRGAVRLRHGDIIQAADICLRVDLSGD